MLDPISSISLCSPSWNEDAVDGDDREANVDTKDAHALRAADEFSIGTIGSGLDDGEFSIGTIGSGLDNGEFSIGTIPSGLGRFDRDEFSIGTIPSGLGTDESANVAPRAFSGPCKEEQR